MVSCPICSKEVKARDINSHIDSGCESCIDTSPPPTQQNSNASQKPPASEKPSVSSFFQMPAAKRAAAFPTPKVKANPALTLPQNAQRKGTTNTTQNQPQRKRSFEDVAPVLKQETD